MKINKDEARILSAAFETEKYRFIEMISVSKEDANAKMKALNSFQKRIDDYSADRRRVGRRSQNSFTDTLKRYCKLINK